MCDLCAKGFFDYEFNSADIDKISNFNEIASNFTYLCTSKFIKYNLTDTDHLLLKSKFYGKGKSGMYFCIFGSCQPLNSLPVCFFHGHTSVALLAQWLFSGPEIHRSRNRIPQGSKFFFLWFMHARFTQALFFIYIIFHGLVSLLDPCLCYYVSLSLTPCYGKAGGT